jgi:hydroxylamine reductase (hybrid-cluster protein)
MLETSYTLSLGQLLVIAPDLKRYLWQKLKLEKTQNSSKATTEKQVGSSITKVGTVVIALNNHMALIQIHIGKNAIEDVLLDGNYGINIITTHLRLRLGL